LLQSSRRKYDKNTHRKSNPGFRDWLAKTENSLHVWGRPDDVDLMEGETYSEEYFQNGLAVIKKCGQRLHIINKKIAWKKKEWVGEETFVI
jgi:hypothetical protein